MLRTPAPLIGALGVNSMSFLNFFEAHSGAYLGAFVLVIALNALVFYVGGRRAEQRFAGQDDQEIRFRERGASGHSNKSMVTKLGGANGVLEVVVTERELWLKGVWPLFSYIGTMFDMTHRVPKSSIRKCTTIGNTIELHFTNETGVESHVVLELKNRGAFASAIDA